MQYFRIIGVYRIKEFLYLAENEDYGWHNYKAEAGNGIAQAAYKGDSTEASFEAAFLGVYPEVQYEVPSLWKRLQGFGRA